MTQYDDRGPDHQRDRSRRPNPGGDGHECQRNPRPDTDEPGQSGELWKRVYSCAYHGCERTWTEWYAPVFDDEGWVNDHDCEYDGSGHAPELDLTEDPVIVDEDDENNTIVIEGECHFCDADGVQVRFECETTDVSTY